MSAARKPCATCPWRVEQTADVIPGFSLELAEGLAATTSDQFGAPMMACHKSREDANVVCAGWLARYGQHSITVRILTMKGEVPVEALEPGPDWPATHETFEEMLEKLRREDG